MFPQYSDSNPLKEREGSDFGTHKHTHVIAIVLTFVVPITNFTVTALPSLQVYSHRTVFFSHHRHHHHRRFAAHNGIGKRLRCTAAVDRNKTIAGDLLLHGLFSVQRLNYNTRGIEFFDL